MYSQARKNESSERPEIWSAYAMNSVVVALPPACACAHPRTIRQNVASPTTIRSASSVAAPRSYTESSNNLSSVGRAGGSDGIPSDSRYILSKRSRGVFLPMCCDHSHSAEVANPSFSHTSDQSLMETLSP